MSLFWSPVRVVNNSIGSYAAAAADQAKMSAQEARDVSQESSERLDQLLTVCTAMWELLREKTALTEEDLIARVAQVDKRDGTPDGRHISMLKHCANCNRALSPRHRRCIYCGFEAAIGNAFEAI